MSKVTETHWKKMFNYDYLGSYSLNQGEEKIVTIKSTGKEQVTGEKGKKEECFTCRFEEFDKPMILNRTNCKAISIVAGSPTVESWVGVRVQLYVEPVAAFGTVTDALRIRDFIPKDISPITKDQRKELEAKIVEAKADEARLFKLLKIESIEKMDLTDFNNAMANLNAKIKYMKENG